MSIEKIEYNGEQLPLATIAKKEGLIGVTLARYYQQIGDIYRAVKLCKENSRGRVVRIDYYGESLAISVIAKREKIDIRTLISAYQITGNIYDAIKRCKERAEARKERAKLIKDGEENQKIEYKNQKLELKEIAKAEGVDASNLRRCFNITGDVYKAVFMAKYKMRKSQTVQIDGVTLDLYDLSLLIGVKYSILNNLLNQGMTIGQIKEIYPCENAGENIKLPNGQTLLKYCVKNKLNFTFMYRVIHTYGKTPEEALAILKTGGQTIPSAWIYDKYMPEFNKLGITRIQTTTVLHNLINKQISLDEDLEERILRRNAKKNGIHEEWGETLYSIIETRKIVGEEFQCKININENEAEFIQLCEAELNQQGSTNLSEIRQKEQEGITHD